MDILSRFNHQYQKWQKNGTLALGANLLFDAVLTGWVIFAGLYTLEILLPTFVSSRIPFVPVMLGLMSGTALLIILQNRLQATLTTEPARPKRLILWLTLLYSLITLSLAHYRFPWWAGALTLALFALAGWLFWKDRPTPLR